MMIFDIKIIILETVYIENLLFHEFIRTMQKADIFVHLETKARRLELVGFNSHPDFTRQNVRTRVYRTSRRVFRHGSRYSVVGFLAIVKVPIKG